MTNNSKQKYWALLLKDIEGKRSCKQSQSYLQVYFNIMYYLLFIPFKIKTDPKSGEYILVSNRLQKVVKLTIYIAKILKKIYIYFYS